MKTITYIERHYTDKHTALDKIKTLCAISTYKCGGLLYCKLNRFDTKQIDADFIIDIKECR